jgi:hypothetical protein
MSQTPTNERLAIAETQLDTLITTTKETNNKLDELEKTVLLLDPKLNNIEQTLKDIKQKQDENSIMSFFGKNPKVLIAGLVLLAAGGGVSTLELIGKLFQ